MNCRRCTYLGAYVRMHKRKLTFIVYIGMGFIRSVSRLR